MPRAVYGSGQTHKGRTANSAPGGVPQRAALRQSENPVLPFVADPRAWTRLARSTERRGHIGRGCWEVKWGQGGGGVRFEFQILGRLQTFVARCKNGSNPPKADI